MLAFKVGALWLQDSACCFQNYFLIICVSSRKETIGEHAFLPSMVPVFAGAYISVDPYQQPPLVQRPHSECLVERTSVRI